jgi:dimeric dUTPase (all-alpha-NTP-PPase superfamily)
MYGNYIENMSLKESVAFIKEMSIHLNQEVNEALYELPWFKPWKNYKNMTEVEVYEAFNRFREEMIDAWHFFMNIMLAGGITAEMLHGAYLAKNAENYERQKRGYTHDVSYREEKDGQN